MATSAPKIAEEERIEAVDAIDKKAEILASLIRGSKHFIAFTGAGISTSAGIPDFRGPEGVWTLRAQGRQRTGKTVCTLQAIPTPSHMALVELQKRGLLKYLISQNCDGLHRKSGIASNKISELHGNSNRESCKECGKEYIRDFRAVASYEQTVRDHRTGHRCARCGGVLHDSIVNFGEALPAEPLELARQHAREADLCLVLGSSLTVTPTNGIPEIPGRRNGAKLAICNLQSTPLDELSDVRVFSKTDDLMVRVMNKLDIPIPPFILRRHLAVSFEGEDEGKSRLRVSGVDEDGTPATFLHSVRLEGCRRVLRTEPFIFSFRDIHTTLDAGADFKIELEFMGHYGEPNLEIVYARRDRETFYLLDYDAKAVEWTTRKENDPASGGDPENVIDLTEDTVLSSELSDMAV